MKKEKVKTELSRREFFKTTAGVTTAGVIAGSSLFSDGAKKAFAQQKPNSRIIGANDRVNFAVIGIGVMGEGHLCNLSGVRSEVDWTSDIYKGNVKVVAACDVWEKARSLAQRKASLPDNRVYNDYRKLLENNDIDAVVVATPDHWHTVIGIDVMESGRHLYVEKPMTHTLEEGFRMWETSKRTNRIVQVGSQGGSDPIFHKARELVKAGKIGRLLWSQGGYCRNNPKGEWHDYKPIDPDANARTVDWERWLGNAPKRSWSPERFFRWRKFWDYGNGVIGDLWPHNLHPLMIGMNLTEFPKSVNCIGGNLCETDKGPGPDGKPYGERREVADSTLMMAEFPNGEMIVLAGGTTNDRGLDYIIRGQKADLLLDENTLRVEHQTPFKDEIEARDETPPETGYGYAKHYDNFINGIKNNIQPNCGIELAVRVQTVVSLAEMSYREGRRMVFDPKTLKVKS